MIMMMIRSFDSGVQSCYVAPRAVKYVGNTPISTHSPGTGKSSSACHTHAD